MTRDQLEHVLRAASTIADDREVLVIGSQSVLGTAPGRGLCLEPHDCVVAKLVAGRAKDFAFADALLQEGLVDPELLAERINLLEDAEPRLVSRLQSWLAYATGSGRGRRPGVLAEPGEDRNRGTMRRV